MEEKLSELEFENQRLQRTITFARKQLDQARKKNEENKSAILSAKKELRENTSHSIGNLWGSEGFEALAELSQYMNPVTDKIADYEEVENKIVLLENLIQSPFFARIDFQFEGEAEYEKVYIGRSSLKRENSFEMDVYDWRSPIASVFYRFVKGPAFYDAPVGRIAGELGLKRQYEINHGVLEYFFDADVQIVDEFLRKLLSYNTSSKMKTIVETIQRDQDVVIRDMENDLMMVQGVAGSGKTSIALHRAAYLMYQGLSSKLSANNILIISPNLLFEQYISNVIPELGEENVVSIIFEEMLAKILKRGHIQSRNQFLENLITGAEYGRTIKRSMEFKTSYQFWEILNRFITQLPDNGIEFEDVCYEGACIVRKEVLKAKIVSGNQDVPLGVRLKQLEDFILEAVHAVKNRRIPKSEVFMIKREIQKFTELNMEELYRKLFREKALFYQLAEGIELPDCMEAIFAFTKENLNHHLLSYDDAIILAFLNLKINGTNEYRNIKQVVIDEAQDYYPLHYEIFHLLFPNSKFTILGDINQTLEKREDLSLYEQIGKILKKKKSSLVTMDKSFRCTNEILNYSLKFIETELEIKSFNRNGDIPEISAAADRSDLIKMIAAEVKRCLENGYQSIGLICKTEKNANFLFELLKDSIDVRQIRDESTADLQGVFLIPVYLSKGLEFDAVLICDADAVNYNSEDDKKLLYIACTRALHRLNLFCQGEESPLLY